MLSLSFMMLFLLKMFIFQCYNGLFLSFFNSIFSSSVISDCFLQRCALFVRVFLIWSWKVVECSDQVTHLLILYLAVRVQFRGYGLYLRPTRSEEICHWAHHVVVRLLRLGLPLHSLEHSRFSKKESTLVLVHIDFDA